MTQNECIYWDNNATAPLRPSVSKRMQDALNVFHANPSSIHQEGQKSKALLEEARRSIAQTFGLKPMQIVFTASATESDLLAVWGLWHCRHSENSKRTKVVISPFEHAAVYENINFLKTQTPAEIFYAPLNQEGVIDLERLERLLAQSPEEFAYGSMIAAHNETGVIQPWNEIATIFKRYAIPFHTDLVQLVGREAIDLNATDVTAASIAFHKVGGPKGTAVLALSEGCKIEPLIRGGGQERKQRAGTENLLSILGAETLCKEIPDLIQKFKNVRKCREEFERQIHNIDSKAIVVGENSDRLPNTSYVIFPQVDSHRIVMNLDLNGICVGVGSACSSGLAKPSRALLHLGYPEQLALRAVRFSMGSETNMTDVQRVTAVLQESMKRLCAA